MDTKAKAVMECGTLPLTYNQILEQKLSQIGLCDFYNSVCNEGYPLTDHLIYKGTQIKFRGFLGIGTSSRPFGMTSKPINKKVAKIISEPPSENRGHGSYLKYNGLKILILDSSYKKSLTDAIENVCRGLGINSQFFDA